MVAQSLIPLGHLKKLLMHEWIINPEMKNRQMEGCKLARAIQQMKCILWTLKKIPSSPSMNTRGCFTFQRPSSKFMKTFQLHISVFHITYMLTILSSECMFYCKSFPFRFFTHKKWHNEMYQFTRKEHRNRLDNNCRFTHNLKLRSTRWQ